MKRDELDLRPGQSVELLQELHILTREGRINQDSRRKLKQVYHLYQFIEKLLQEVPVDGPPVLSPRGARCAAAVRPRSPAHPAPIRAKPSP